MVKVVYGLLRELIKNLKQKYKSIIQGRACITDFSFFCGERPANRKKSQKH